MLLSTSVDEPGLTAISRGEAEADLLPDRVGLFHVIAEGARLRPRRAVLSRPVESGWEDVDFGRFHRDVVSFAEALLAWGVEHGDRIAVLGRNSYEWVVVDFAALAIGAIVVPVYPTASEQQIDHLLADSGAVYGFTETAEQRELLTRLGGARWRQPVRLLSDPAPIGSGAVPVASFAERRAAVRADDIATIVYTSGTTGMPKGCVLTHRNMFASSANTVRHLPELFRAEDASTLLALPLSHIFGRTVLLACLYGGTRSGLLAGIPELPAAMPGFRPTFLALVPYALEKIRKRCRSAIGPEAERVAVDYGRALFDHDAVDLELAAAHRTLNETEFAAVRGVFGGRCRYVISGGASLDATTDAFFAGAGVQILGAYGLTESATAVTINQVHANRHGSVGRPVPGTAVALATDGEVLVSGPNTSPGYWPAAADYLGTWLPTGDLGAIDADGYLSITGRRKEILVTSGGKNVAPTPLEDRVRLHPLVSNCMVVGEGRSFVAALVTLDAAAVAAWAAERESTEPQQDRHRNPELAAAIATAVDDANGLVSRAESIREFRIVAGDFTVENGQLTPSLKLRRAVIEQAYAEDISALYEN
ncbi:AMP-dependent synthetase/ligase [Nocardia inohanensis]|uniref:AMP-dependent synthetase/ligase n=1 Tax=Nocardia inohanensis TaxID=209246 RepID=UPI000A66656D|nr:AMP-dependent synthetase/ligase [Nocardia inohanensis]